MEEDIIDKGKNLEEMMVIIIITTTEEETEDLVTKTIEMEVTLDNLKVIIEVIKMVTGEEK